VLILALKAPGRSGKNHVRHSGSTSLGTHFLIHRIRMYCWAFRTERLCDQRVSWRAEFGSG
jgi:hypothetical protein